MRANILRCMSAVLFCAALVLPLSDARATDPVTAVAAAGAAASTANSVVPAVVGVVKDVVEVPKQALGVLRLPLGVAQCVLAPVLPGSQVASGCKNIGQGLAAPFKTAGAVLQVPVGVANAAIATGKAATGIGK